MVDKSVIDYYRFAKEKGLDRRLSQSILKNNYSCIENLFAGKQDTLRYALNQLFDEGFDFKKESYCELQKQITNNCFDAEFYIFGINSAYL